jgi:DnaJ-class molecular chaperone
MCAEVTVVEITAVEMDGQTVPMQDCPRCHGRGAVDLADAGWKVRGAQCPECHGLRVVPYGGSR